MDLTRPADSSVPSSARSHPSPMRNDHADTQRPRRRRLHVRKRNEKPISTVPCAVVAWRFLKTSTVLLASNAVSCRMLLEGRDVREM